MSYPPVRYPGTEGQVSARLQPASRPPDLTIGATAVHYPATTASTSG